MGICPCGCRPNNHTANGCCRHEEGERQASYARTLTIRTGLKQQYVLTLRLAERPWHNDDGLIDEADRAGWATNVSSLNVDFAIVGATLLADAQPLMENGSVTADLVNQ